MEEECKIYEDQEDYIEDVYDQFRDAIRRYTMYAKMFGYPKEWKPMREELRKFIHYELERSFSKIIVKDTVDGIIIMKFEEKD
jgi:hypothetical protein